MNLTVAVLTYNKWPELLADCLESIIPQLPQGAELLVVDNGATPPVPQSQKYRLVRLEKNIGNVAGQNKCFELATYNWVLFVSDDVRLQNGCIQELWNRKQENRQIMPIIYEKEGTQIQSSGTKIMWPGYGINQRDLPDKERITDYVPSICYLMNRYVMKMGSWKFIGEFDETLPMAYEDVDIGIRFWRKKIPPIVEPRAGAIHLGNSTLQYTKKDAWRFHQARLRVIDKHFRGIDRWTRRSAVILIDGLRSLL